MLWKWYKLEEREELIDSYKLTEMKLGPPQPAASQLTCCVSGAKTEKLLSGVNFYI